MARKRNADLSATAQAKAKLEAVAKVTYERKHTVSETIPADVTRARASAWLDLIPPMTEWAGLKGDEFAHKREMLRLERAETLAEIVRKCGERRKSDIDTEKSVPNKFLFQFLEQASFEIREGPLVDIWANLLLSASEKFTPHHIHFLSILSRIDGQQAKIFRRMFNADDIRSLELSIDNVGSYFEYHIIKNGIIPALLDIDRRPGPATDRPDSVWIGYYTSLCGP